jgi:hypothetical protein
MPSSVLRMAKALLPLGLLAYFIWAFVDVDAFLSLAAKTAVLPALAYLSTLIAARWLQAVQTSIALNEAGIRIRSAEIFSAQLVASFYTMFVPGDVVGGGVTWYLLKQSRGRGALIAVILVYMRLVLVASALPVAIIGLLAEERLYSPPLLVALFLFSVITLVLTLPLVSQAGARMASRLLGSVSTNRALKSAKAASIAAALKDGVSVCASASATSTLTVFALALVLHGLGAAGLWLAFEAAQASVPFFAILWVWPLMIVVHMLPISLGGVGVREFTLFYVLNSLYGTSGESILLLSMIALAATTLLSLAGGIWNTFRVALPDGKSG